MFLMSNKLWILSWILLGQCNGHNFNPNSIFYKYMSYKFGSFPKLSKPGLEELIEMVKTENMFTILDAKPKEIRRLFDPHDKNIDALCLYGRLSSFLNQKGVLSFCPIRNVTCSKNNTYRSLDGLCNNLSSPTWGSFLWKYDRFLKPQYGDGKNSPRGSTYVKGKGYQSRLPSPRKISFTMHEDENRTSDDLTHLYMQFGQFVSHDMTKTTKGDLDCCDPKISTDPRCFNIDLRGDEYFDGEFNRTCMDFTRSDSHCQFSEWREQINSVTSYLDCSTIYGSNREVNKELRNGVSDGTLKENSFLPHFLPTRSDLGQSLYKSQEKDDFVAGDGRCQAHSTILAMHVIWFREHNRIANALGPLLKHYIHHLDEWEQDEIIFQEVRKIVIAEFTTVLYSEYLTILLSNNCPGIELQPNSKYDPEVDASIMNEFTTASFRFGHSLVQSVFEGVDQPWRLGSFFGDAQFATSFDGHGIEKELVGAAHQSCQNSDRFISKELTKKLYLNKEKLNKTANWKGLGSDLASLNIQRGRDHGIPDYNTIRDKCGLPRVDNSYFGSTEIPPQFDEQTWEKLQSIYENVDDFDLFTAGLSEKKSGGKRLGETFHCLICEQFKRLKNGDRFFFTHYENEETNSRGLHIDIQNMIMKRRFSDILCENSIGLEKLKPQVFKNEGENNPELSCNDGSRPKLDFELIAHHFRLEHLKTANVDIYFEINN
ncbi:salivary peroxidase/catechol oxidase [Lepeophtheirus salmonis]|uniref:salivary peroxidase/catechol oxidase n=1 Tax=Lepeophtheirus salmonis TaxID=72036 RepID=UPI001AE3A705|nr:peroxidase-like [Lepeophtheirus salmonis]